MWLPYVIVLWGVAQAQGLAGLTPGPALHAYACWEGGRSCLVSVVMMETNRSHILKI